MFLRFSVCLHLVCKGSVFGPRTGNLNPTSSMLLILFSMMGPLWSSISNGTPKAVKGVSISLRVQEASVACLSFVQAACLPRDQDVLLSHFVMRALLSGGTPSHSSTIADTEGGAGVHASPHFCCLPALRSTQVSHLNMITPSG